LGPGNPEYQSAVDGLRKSAEKLIGPIDDLPDSWLTNEETMQLFEKAAEGDIKAIEQLKK
jgi:hypothetical protein